MYFENAIERINNIKNKEISDKFKEKYGYKFLKELSNFYSEINVKPIPPVYSNIAKILGDKEEIIIYDYCDEKILDEIEDKKVIKNYLQLARYADKYNEYAKYLKIYDPLIKVFEYGGRVLIKYNSLEITNEGFYPLSNWYLRFQAKEN